MSLLVDGLTWLLLLGGAALLIVGGLGLLRMPDFFTRLHPAGVIDTGGMGLLLAGCAMQAGFSLVLAKLVLITLFVLLTTPTACHATARAALAAGLRPLSFGPDSDGDEPK